MHPLVTQLQQRLEAAQADYVKYYEALLAIRDQSSEFTQSDRVDLIYLLRELVSVAETVKKEGNKTSGLQQRLTCVVWSDENRARPDLAGPVRGAIATGTPSVGSMSSLPKWETDPDGVQELCIWLDIPVGPFASGDARFHWPTIQEKMNAALSEAKPIPPVLAGALRPTFTVSVRARSTSK